MNLVKNPIVIGIIAGIITYLYIHWNNETKHKKNPKSKRKPVSLVTPIVVSIIVWFIATNYLDTVTKQIGGGKKVANAPSQKLINVNAAINNSIGSESYHIIGKNNIRLPPTDVFIDLARFNI